ncbi:MAG: bifunctional glutamate N-acetyltransferase/amino-acid acetyltransferase ArgJ [Elusimicrobia bacterium]|jgi:glutamate N-acetyltransferase/amino-acid N-acetyltransferase|nr:bifunctional glutamate N-acetyltransferase/amino-acid acetyltransferase ArgJ [Elusimicrobiota bacterium]
MDCPAGFRLSGIKFKDSENLAFIYSPQGFTSAGIFTLNANPAHPVQFCRKNLTRESHRLIFVNKGYANAATGPAGLKKQRDLSSHLSEIFDIEEEEILFASTGVIGKNFDIPDDNIQKVCALKEYVKPYDFAEAIMTTDTVKKVATSEFEINGRTINITGIAKGAGMIKPDMATMLSFIMTDAAIEKNILQKALKDAADKTFNCLNVDSETSTNDTLILAASGAAQNKTIESECENYKIFYEHLRKVCRILTEKIAADGEGATKLIKINLKGAPDEETAKRGARAIASSPLCKTAFYGASPNWGRIVSAIGAKGIRIEITKFNIYINGVAWIKNGSPVKESEEQVREIMAGSKYKLDIDLNNGDKEYLCYSCDFSTEYVRINAHYVS